MADIAIRRDREGHFLPGTKPGPGNPHVKTVMALRRQLFEYAEDHGVVQELLTAALNLLKDPKSKHHGDALKFWAQYLFGKPDQSVSIDVSSSDRPKIDLDSYSPQEQEQIRQTLEMVATRQLPQ